MKIHSNSRLHIRQPKIVTLLKLSLRHVSLVKNLGLTENLQKNCVYCYWCGVVEVAMSLNSDGCGQQRLPHQPPPGTQLGLVLPFSSFFNLLGDDTRRSNSQHPVCPLSQKLSKPRRPRGTGSVNRLLHYKIATTACNVQTHLESLCKETWQPDNSMMNDDSTQI